MQEQNQNIKNTTLSTSNEVDGGQAEENPVSAPPKQEVIPVDTTTSAKATGVEKVLTDKEDVLVVEETPIIETPPTTPTQEIEPSVVETVEGKQPQSAEAIQTQKVSTQPHPTFEKVDGGQAEIQTVENEISPQPQDSVIPKNIDRSRTTHSAPLRSRTASSIFSIQNLLTKARAKIQERKRKKLDKIMSLFESPPTSPKGSVSGGQGNSEISNSDIQKLLRTTKRSATRYLDILEKEQKIIQIGKAGRGVKYIKKP